MNEIKHIKGMPDVLPKESSDWSTMEEKLKTHLQSVGFKEIRTPYLEYTKLFERGVGEATDIVEKEMYTFLDKNNESLTLRPEGTAGVMRAFLEHHLDQQGTGQKLYYLGPMFRYERPQKGRLRQFHQLGAEVLNSTHALDDALLIELLYSLALSLGIENLQLHVNSLGDVQSRQAYKSKLVLFLQANIDQLDEHSKLRIEKNPLRILDSKNENTQILLKQAPSILDSLSDVSKQKFELVLKALEKIKVPFNINPNIVRGLDYYCETVFELSALGLGAQNVIGGGGRYDQLSVELGDKSIPSVGFAMGLERLLLVSKNIKKPIKPKIVFLPMGEEESLHCFKDYTRVKSIEQPLEVECVFGKDKLKNLLKTADQIHATHALILGSQELLKKQYLLKNLKTGDQQSIFFEDLEKTIKTLE